MLARYDQCQYLLRAAPIFIRIPHRFTHSTSIITDLHSCSIFFPLLKAVSSTHPDIIDPTHSSLCPPLLFADSHPHAVLIFPLRLSHCQLYSLFVLYPLPFALRTPFCSPLCVVLANASSVKCCLASLLCLCPSLSASRASTLPHSPVPTFPPQ